MTLCNCGEPSKYNDPFTPHPRPQNYCSSCFSSYLEKKMTRGFPRAIRGHSVAVAVSGGKDSITLLEIILKSQKMLKIPSVTAIFLEEQVAEIQSHRPEIVKILNEKYPDLNILYEEYSSFYRYSLPELVKRSIERKLRFTPCMMCGILKKNALFKIARDLKIPYIALGTTLEDEAATVLLNIIRGRQQTEISGNTDNHDSLETFQPQLLKPLARISEDLIQTYVNINKLPVITTTCPYATQSIRSDITSLIENLKKRDPKGSLLFNIAKRKTMNESIKKSPLMNCRRCQTPSNQSLCSACRILTKLT